MTLNGISCELESKEITNYVFVFNFIMIEEIYNARNVQSYIKKKKRIVFQNVLANVKQKSQKVSTVTIFMMVAYHRSGVSIISERNDKI